MKIIKVNNMADPKSPSQDDSEEDPTAPAAGEDAKLTAPAAATVDVSTVPILAATTQSATVPRLAASTQSDAAALATTQSHADAKTDVNNLALPITSAGAGSPPGGRPYKPYVTIQSPRGFCLDPKCTQGELCLHINNFQAAADNANMPRDQQLGILISAGYGRAYGSDAKKLFRNPFCSETHRFTDEAHDTQTIIIPMIIRGTPIEHIRTTLKNSGHLIIADSTKKVGKRRSIN